MAEEIIHGIYSLSAVLTRVCGGAADDDGSSSLKKLLRRCPLTTPLTSDTLRLPRCPFPAAVPKQKWEQRRREHEATRGFWHRY